MATVYRAEHERLRKIVALKVMDPLVAEDEEYRERFLREARAAAKLNHQNIVRALDAGQGGGFYYIAMELVEGVDLRRRIEDDGTLPEREALEIGISVAHALEEASRHGIVHRDVKPENILLDANGGVKLTDLGLAKVRDEDLTLTKKGLTVGTVAYFAPEQALGQPDLDVRTDLYALGATLYAALSGELPFGRGENVPETMQKILTETAPSLEKIAPDVSAPARAAIERLMERDRKKRPASAREAIRILEAAVKGEMPGAGERRPDSARVSARGVRRRRSPVGRGASVGLATGGVLLVAVGVAALVLHARHDVAPDDPPAPTVPAATIDRPKPRPAVVLAPPTPPRPLPPPVPDELDMPVPHPELAHPDPPAETPPEAEPAHPDPAAVASVEAPLAIDNEPGRGLAKLVHATLEIEAGDHVVLTYEKLDANALLDFDVTGDAPEATGETLIWRLGPKQHARLLHKLRLFAPVTVSYDLTVPEAAGKARVETVLLDARTADAKATGLGSFGGVRLDAWSGDAPEKKLAGSDGAESLFAQGSRHKVVLEFGGERAAGTLDGKERYRLLAPAPLPARLGFDLLGGVRAVIQNLRLQGRVDRSWLRGAIGASR
jgi:hypothetical protein